MKHAPLVLFFLLALGPLGQSQETQSNFSEIDAFADEMYITSSGLLEKMKGHIVITLKYEEKDKEPMRIKGDAATLAWDNDTKLIAKIIIDKDVVVSALGGEITADKLEWDMQKGIITLSGNVEGPFGEKSRMMCETLIIDLKTGAQKILKGGVVDVPVPNSQEIAP